jgi:N-acetylmuramoyl-L-alanine amidase
MMWRPLSLVTLTLIGSPLLTIPIRSQQAQGFQGLAISQVQQPPAPAPQQNPSPSSNSLPSQLSAPSEATPGITVVLDPAHGGADFGARGRTGLAESDVVLDFARAARIALEAQRVRVLLTREGNQDPSFDSRSAMINGVRNAVFVSLHVSSTGPVGTARTYYYVFPSDATPGLNPTAAAPQATARANLIEWDHAQRPSVDLSKQLASLAQNELVQRFKGSPEMPIGTPVRQLRTIAAPAIAIELSSIDVTDAKRLDQMAQPLAEAIGRAVAEFHYSANNPAAATGGGH